MTRETYTLNPEQPLVGPRAIIEPRLDQIFVLRAMAKSVGWPTTINFVRDRLLGHVNEEILDIAPNKHHQLPFRMTTMPSDLLVYAEVMRRGAWDIPKKHRENVNGLPIFDIGANIGVASVKLANMFPDSKITSVEPYMRNYILLCTNAARYPGRIEPVHAAFSESEGRVPLVKEVPRGHYIRPLYSSSIQYNGSTATETYAASITPSDILNIVGDDEIGVLKVDIEGAEAPIFDSPDMGDVLERVRVLMVEPHDRYVPGSSTKTIAAAQRAGLSLMVRTNHEYIWVRE